MSIQNCLWVCWGLVGIAEPGKWAGKRNHFCSNRGEKVGKSAHHLTFATEKPCNAGHPRCTVHSGYFVNRLQRKVQLQVDPVKRTAQIRECFAISSTKYSTCHQFAAVQSEHVRNHAFCSVGPVLAQQPTASPYSAACCTPCTQFSTL